MFKKTLLQRAMFGLTVSSLAAAPLTAVHAQDDDDDGIEEVVVLGRLVSAAQSLTNERMEVPFSADYLSFEVMARAGDPDLASALRRAPGLTVVDGKFVYVRGLGERYSAVTVNGAAVPSPELSRSIIPLDLLPTTIVDSVKIQKSPSPDALAAFGGGLINIRTKSIPDALVASLQAGIGGNSVSTGEDGLASNASGTPLPQPIFDAIPRYRGDITPSNIQRIEGSTFNEALAIHGGLLDSLNNDIGLRTESLDPDYDVKAALGNKFLLGNSWELGGLLTGTWSRKFRNENQVREELGAPQRKTDIQRTFETERQVLAASAGLGYLEDHSVQVDYFLIQDDEDQAALAQGFSGNFRQEFGFERVTYRTRLEERELDLLQVSGEHAFLETPYLTEWLKKAKLDNLTFDWFYSDATATTDIPNQTAMGGFNNVIPETAERLSTQLETSTAMGTFSFLQLEDQQESYGGNIKLPLDFTNVTAAVSGGWWYTQKARDYLGYTVNVNTSRAPAENITGTTADVFTDENFSVDNGFQIFLGQATGNESYLAAQKVNAGYGMLDLTFGDSWRLTGGARWEDYQQAALAYNVLDFDGRLVNEQIADLQTEDQTAAFQEDDVFASLAGTYMGYGFLGADDYQIRLSYGQTVVRPDLRELADVQYIDPELLVQVRGNPFLRPSPMDNFELRAEFYYANGDNFTVSAYYKDIDQPIEQFNADAGENGTQLSFANANTGEVLGVEFEGLKSLPYGLFLAGNVTLSDSEIDVGETPGLPQQPTNATRRMTGHSEWVVNGTLGYDADSGRHSAYLNYNVFGERIFGAGIAGNDDAFEQPIHTLGLVYKFFPTDYLELNFQLDNILDEERQFTQVNRAGQEAKILTQEIGVTFGASVKVSF